jgi:hypothetical protein
MEDANAESGASFVVVIDEWDCIFRERPNDKAAQRRYLDFLRLFLKDKDYVALAYLTGILPVRKYGTHSALNMFNEFSMTGQGPLARLTGFTQEEVEALCAEHGAELAEMEAWYNGYLLSDGRGETVRAYNPRSVVHAIHMGSFGNYWTRTETYEALKVYIDMDAGGLREDVVALLAGDRRAMDADRFQNDMVDVRGADDVLALLVHLGYLGYLAETREVFVPNKEISDEYVTAMDGAAYSEVARAVAASQALLGSAWDRDEGAVAEGVAAAHAETAHLVYNDENALSYTLSLAFYAAREHYTVVRELPSGKGFADLTFVPRPGARGGAKPAMLVELKWDEGAKAAIAQARERDYPAALKDYAQSNGGPGLLLVALSYDKKSKRHSCEIEEV